MMIYPTLHSLCQSKYLRDLSRPSRPHTGLDLHANHQNDSVLTADSTMDARMKKMQQCQQSSTKCIYLQFKYTAVMKTKDSIDERCSCCNYRRDFRILRWKVEIKEEQAILVGCSTCSNNHSSQEIHAILKYPDINIVYKCSERNISKS